MSKYLVNRFRNVTVALNTPFDSCGAVSPDAIRNFVQHQYEKGIRALYVCGNTGEGFLLPLDERKFVLETVMKSVPADITVIAHVAPRQRAKPSSSLRIPSKPARTGHPSSPAFTTAPEKKASAVIGQR